ELGSDGAALSVHTSVDSPYADEHDPETGRLLYKYQGTDPVQRDNVALRHAMERQRPLLYLVGVDPGVYDAVFPVYVTGDDPLRLQFTLMADQLDASTHQRSDTLTVLRRAYTTRAVMARLHQQQFRGSCCRPTRTDAPSAAFGIWSYSMPRTFCQITIRAASRLFQMDSVCARSIIPPSIVTSLALILTRACTCETTS